MSPAPAHTVALLRRAERIARLSDRVIGFGPFNFGLDGLLSLLPVSGVAYTLGAGAWILQLGHKAGASPRTLAEMAAYIAVDAVASGVPVLGSAVDVLVPGHIMATKALRRELERRHGPIDTGVRARGRFSWGRQAATA